MKSNAKKPDVKTNAKGDLKSIPMPELEKQLGSLPDGISQAEAKKRLRPFLEKNLST